MLYSLSLAALWKFTGLGTEPPALTAVSYLSNNDRISQKMQRWVEREVFIFIQNKITKICTWLECLLCYSDIYAKKSIEVPCTLNI